MHELTVADALAAARHNSVSDGKSGDGNAKLSRCEVEQRLVRVGSNFANVSHAVEKAGGVTAVRCSVGVAEDERDRFRPDAQFFCNCLSVIATHARAGFGST